MNISLKPKNILIVGGGSGIGYAIAQKLLDAGADNIVIASRSVDKLENALMKLQKKATQNVYAVQFDIADVQSQENAIERVQKLLKKNGDYLLDGLVLSAGINFDGSNWKGFNVSEADWDRVMNVNLKGTFFMMRNFSNYLSNNNRKGNICVVSSISAHRDLLSVYQISKHTISRIVHAYGKYLCEKGVVLNCVEPGMTNTDMTRYLHEYTDGVRPGKPWNDASIGRLIRPEEIAEVVFMLMSNIGETMSGSCILVGGGNKGLQP